VLDVTNDLFVARSNAVSTENELYFRHAAVLQAAGMLTIDLFANRTEYDPASYDPALAGLAGLPFGPVLDPFDNVLLNDWAEPAGVTTEGDIEYEEADTLRMPLQPMQP
jgi:hypothetical protein